MRIKFIQEIIDRLRGKAFALESVVNKYECYLRAKNYHTLLLGSSHMEHGYISSEGEINMGSSSQDLYYSYNLYKILNKEELKRVIITFSVFTPGDFLIKSSLNKICIMFKLLYGFPYQNIDQAKKSKLAKWEKFYKKHIEKYRKNLNLPEDYNGNLLSYSTKKVSLEEVKKIEKRALAHFKINQKSEKNMEYCIKLLEDTKQNSQDIYFVLPPATDFYKSVLPSSDVIFEELYKVCENYPHAKIIDLYDSKEFSNGDFVDGDHLNIYGCKKITEIIRRNLNE